MTDDEQIQQTPEAGNRVSITKKDGSEALVGLVEVANEFGYLVKPKGSSRAKLIRVEEIDSIEVLDDEDEKLKATNVKQVTSGTVKRHLLNYHGQALSEVNGWSTEQALGVHEDLHQIHKGEVGHVHVAPKSEGDNATE